MQSRNRLAVLLAAATSPGVSMAETKPAVELTRAQVEDIVRRSYPYVAMYNVNSKFAMDPNNPMSTGGLNQVKANTTLLDHTMKAIARPNNDTPYIGAVLDLRNEPIILEAPAFDSKYVSLMVTGYDHYVNVPSSTQFGDFAKPSRIMFFTKRTKGYGGEKVEGIDNIEEMTGDFVSAVYRVMPHLNEPERMKRNLEAMQSVKVLTLSEYQGQPSKGRSLLPSEFPKFGKTDFDIFESNLLEVMQFVINHTTFDPKDEIDSKLLAVYAPLGVIPGRAFDPAKVADIDGPLFRKVAEEVASGEMARTSDTDFQKENGLKQFLPKGKMSAEVLLFQSVIGPIGLPASEAIYETVLTSDGSPMSAKSDYIIRMKQNDLPPAKAFWSVTLYDTKNGFFIPNDRKKYSVGENGGFKLNDDGGIDIAISEKKPDGVAEENWLPVNRGDYDVDLIMRIYAPDLERYKTWTPPKAEKIE